MRKINLPARTGGPPLFQPCPLSLLLLEQASSSPSLCILGCELMVSPSQGLCEAEKKPSGKVLALGRTDSISTSALPIRRATSTLKMEAGSQALSQKT